VFTSGLYLRSTSSITGPHTGFVETCMCACSCQCELSLAYHIYHPIQPDPTPVCTVGNVYGSRVSGSESVPVRSQGKYSSWHVQSRLAERGGKWRPTPFSPGSLSMRPLVTC
jgi:hypothetical protein